MLSQIVRALGMIFLRANLSDVAPLLSGLYCMMQEVVGNTLFKKILGETTEKIPPVADLDMGLTAATYGRSLNREGPTL